MAYYLKTSAAGNMAVQLPSAISLSGIGAYIEFSGFAESGNAGGEYRLVGEQAGYNYLFGITDTALVLRVAGTFLSQNANVKPAINVDFVLRAEINSNGVWQLSVNGASPSVTMSGAAFQFDQMMRYAGAEGDVFRGGLYYVEIGDSGGATNRWDADASGGTGSVLPDTVGTADATLVGFPTDGSQWGGSAPAASLTMAGDLQPGTSFTVNYSNFTGVPVSPVTLTDSNSNSITVPVTISDNADGTGTATGTMPALPASGTAQGLLFGNVTVELST